MVVFPAPDGAEKMINLPDVLEWLTTKRLTVVL